MNTKRVDGPQWDAEALHDIGAISIFEVRDGDGHVIGFDLYPDDIDLTGYEAALAQRTLRRLRAYAASKRFETETGGIVVAGMPVATSRDSQNLISGAFALSGTDASLTVSFKAADGEFRRLDGAGIQTLALAVASHVQACFAAEADVIASIEAGTITGDGQIDAAFSSIGAP